MSDNEKLVPVAATCGLCGGTFAKSGLTRHLQSCRKKCPSEAALEPERIFHLVISGKYMLDYYVHVEAPANLTLGELDGFLRTIWLECCGHLSGFEFKQPAAARGLRAPDFNDPIAAGRFLDQLRGRLSAVMPEPEEMWHERLSKRLSKGVEFEHDYDYGSTTTCELRVVDDFKAVRRGDGVFLLARNNPPDIGCMECDEPATWICTECRWDSRGTLCDKCAEDHACGEEMLLPLVNSPRVGECGYGGPSEWVNEPAGSRAAARAKPKHGAGGVEKLPRRRKR